MSVLQFDCTREWLIKGMSSVKKKVHVRKLQVKERQRKNKRNNKKQSSNLNDHGEWNSRNNRMPRGETMALIVEDSILGGSCYSITVICSAE